MEHKTLEEISVENDELYLIETIPFVYTRKRRFFIQLLFPPLVLSRPNLALVPFVESSDVTGSEALKK
jgi:hypothetical protein